MPLWLFAFAALPAKRSPVPVMLVGPPGSGKTITVAKLAARPSMRLLTLIMRGGLRPSAAAMAAAMARGGGGTQGLAVTQEQLSLAKVRGSNCQGGDACARVAGPIRAVRAAVWLRCYSG